MRGGEHSVWHVGDRCGGSRMAESLQSLAEDPAEYINQTANMDGIEK
jgi:hypothetical protein